MLQKRIITILIITLLCGCAAERVAQENDIVHKKAVEEAAWVQLQDATAAKCGAGALPSGRDSAVQLSNCVTGLVREYVLPKAVFPDLLLSSREEAMRLAKEYAAGNMSSAEYRQQSEARLKRYRSAMGYLMSEQGSQRAG